MKRLVSLLSVLFICATVFAQGIEFQKESYADVLKMAKKQKKLVFVDIYTSWCGPCKHMAKNIFPEKKVGDYFNTHFLNLQLDAEKSEDGKMVAKKFAVSAYPTFLFIDGNGELVYRFLGGKTVEMLVEEGQKALAAYEVRPELEKYEKKYAKGKRDRDFLNQYIVLKNDAGLDCSDVLLDYFSQLDDAELVDSVQLERIAKMSIYHQDFANRLVDLVCKKAKEQPADKKVLTAINKSVCSYLSACLKQVAQYDEDTSFEEVLALKDRLFAATGAKDSGTAAAMGGGNIYVPSDLSRLDYYLSKKKSAQFVETYVSYIAQIQKEYEESRSKKAAMEQTMNDKLEEAKKSGNEEEINMVKKMRAMMFAFSNIDDYYVATSMLQYLENYEKVFEGEKNETYKQQVADWYVFLHQLSPSAKAAVFVADHLLALGKKDVAVKVLELGLKEGSSAPSVEKEDVAACQKKLDSLK